MDKIAIITDSTSDISDDLREKYDIRVLPLQVIYQNKVYRDRVNITPDQVYQNMEKEVPKTSLPLTADVAKTLDSFKQDGYTHVLGIFISSGLSGTYNMIRNMANEYKDDMTFELIDSKSISWGIAFGLIEAAREREKSQDFQKVVAAAKEAVKNSRCLFVIPTLSYLKKGGRMGRVEGTVGDILNIKPIVGVDELLDGQYFTIKKVRGRKKSIHAIYEIAYDLVKDKKSFEIVVLHGGAEQEAKELYDKFKAMTNCRCVRFAQVSPVIGVHTGPGLVAFGIYSEEGLGRMKEDK